MKFNSFLASSLLLLASCQQQVHIFDGIHATRYQGDRCAAVSLTFDDGMLCQYTDVAPALEHNGLRGTIWIIGSNMDQDVPDYPWMTWQQVADLARRGHEISNHSWSHPALTSLSEEQLRWEVAYNDSVIEAVTGRKPITFAYPYNAFNDTVVAICSEGRVGTRTFWEAQGQRENHQTLETMCQWLDTLTAHREWGVTMTHGTTYGWDMWENPQELYDFFAHLAGVSDSVWTAPFAEVSAYIAERDDLDLDFTLYDHRFELTPSLRTLDSTLFCQPLTFRIDGTFSKANPTAQQDGQECPVTNKGTHILVDAVPNGHELIIMW